MFSVTVNFDACSRRDLRRRYARWALDHVQLGLSSTIVNHADFGGVTSASHYICFRNISKEGVIYVPCTPRCLSHVLNAADSPERTSEIPAPMALTGPHPRAPIVVDGLLRQEGLFDVHLPGALLARPSCFKKTGWVRGKLTAKEFLHAHDVPLSLFPAILAGDRSGSLRAIGASLSPVVITAVFNTIWSSKFGGRSSLDETNIRNTDAQPEFGQLPRDSELPNERRKEAKEGATVEGSKEGKGTEEEEMKEEGKEETEKVQPLLESSSIQCKDALVHVESPDECNAGSFRPAATPDTGPDRQGSDPSPDADRARLEEIKRKHDLAKAVKSDDAAVPIHIWDNAICRGEAGTTQKNALASLREFLLRVYRRRLLQDAVGTLNKMYGGIPPRALPHKRIFVAEPTWRTRARQEREPRAHREALQEIMRRAANNDWFEYPAGSRLHYFRFPSRYQRAARDGVRVFFQDEGPSLMRRQPDLGPEEREVLHKKILKFIKKGYIVPPRAGQVKSLMKYFAVPKGVLEGVTLDWRIVFHAGANKLNESVWAPSFVLPSLNSLLRIVDSNSLMSDRDMGEMFLNFMLDPRVWKFAAIDLGPIGYTPEECEHRWMTWARNLMGFRPSPYNSVKMYLVAEEILRGDRHDPSNAFQYDYIMLNLPGSENYNPSIAWISKRRADGSLATDFVCFVDDQRLAGEGSERVVEGGHALSSREAFLGLQDALRKIRASHGTRNPGAWAGACVVISEELGVMVLTSQEKWDRMKELCRHWLGVLKSGETLLDHKKLLSDRGFMVYVTQAYPSLKPYLKGFNLSLETWRGGRDDEGWKLGGKALAGQEEREQEVDREMEESAKEEAVSMEELKMQALLQSSTGEPMYLKGPPSGVTVAVPRFRQDLEALIFLTMDDEPIQRRIRSNKKGLTAFYGFGDASSSGFGASVRRPDGLHTRYGIWPRDVEDESSNFRELKNLVDTVGEETRHGYLCGGELWLFTDNSTAESCIHKGSSSSKRLHDLVLRLKKLELEAGFTLFVVHVAGTRMIAQGTDGLSRGVFLEGVMAGRDMLAFVPLAEGATMRQPKLIEYVQEWVGAALHTKANILKVEEWFQEGHGISGGEKGAHGVWIPRHAPNGRVYLWTPPPVIADVALEECMKAIHKRTDAFHIFLIPRLFSPAWLRLFYKFADFMFVIPVGSPLWPHNMHEPLFVGISLPFIRCRPWSLRGTPLLVELAGRLREVFKSGEGDGRNILCQLLRIPGRLGSMSDDMARQVLRVPGEGPVPHEDPSRRRGKPVVQAKEKGR